MHTLHAHHPLILLLAGAMLSPAREHSDPPPTPPILPLDPPPFEEPIAPPAPGLPDPSQDVAVNLIVLLVQKGQLTREEGLALIQQAEAQAEAARTRTAVLPPPLAEEDVRVTYVPQAVRNDIRDEIKQELLAEVHEQSRGFSSAPEWTSKFRPFGDIQVRYEGIFFSDANDNTGTFPNFNSINTGAPFDTSGFIFSPQHNVDQDRNQARFRARAGTEILLGDGFSGGLRLATGESSSPVSPNQTFGSSGGNFSKYSIWLDRAFLAYNAAPDDENELTFLAGRFDNPFFSTDLLWDADIGFDGLAARGRFKINDNVSTFVSGGIFPIYNTDFNFSSNRPDKFESTDKWLYGAQAGIEWKITEDLTAKFGASYYDFQDIEGRLSSPFVPLGPHDAGDTDGTRPSFAQRGNTYMALRNITPTAANDFGTIHQYQYYGLATPFRILTGTGRLDYTGYDPFNLSLVGEISKNLAFDSRRIGAIAVNNRSGSGLGRFDGGDLAWNLSFQFGNTALEEFGDWVVGLGYRYVESDAIVDAFTDSNFGGGGTNLKGFTLGGIMALTPNVRLGIKWMSADEIAGPPLGTDTLQFDINAKF